MSAPDIIGGFLVGGGIAAFLYVLARVIAVLWNELIHGRPKRFTGPRYTEIQVIGDVCRLPPELRRGGGASGNSGGGRPSNRADPSGTQNNVIARHDGTEL